MAESVAQSPAAAPEAWVAEIERGWRDRVPDAFFVLPRVLRRVLRSELEITNPWVKVPHRKTYVIERHRLLWLVALDELGVDSVVGLPDRVLLIARPEDERLARLTRSELLAYYWRLLFHARLDALLQQRTAPSALSAAQLRERIDRLGQEQFDEIRAVLRQEGMLTRPGDARHAYAEFVAVFWELRCFAPDLLPLYFPSLPAADVVEERLRGEGDARSIFAALRPPELAGVDPAHVGTQSPGDASLFVLPIAAPSQRSQRRCRQLSRTADFYRQKGNDVRAALFRQRALTYAPLESLPETEAALRDDLRSLAGRLQQALELDDAETEEWLKVCGQLTPGALAGFWNANARILYDLQKVCIDHERESYRVDVWGWVKSRGRQPLKRPLPNQRVVNIAKHLRTATRRIPRVRIDREGRRALAALLHHAAEQAEHILRTRMQPVVSRALLEVGVTPRDLVERVAFRKLTAELLDVVVQRGFLTLGNVRDACSRSQLKLPDLADAREFVFGDPLLRADLQFAATLDGVYQKGPFYLRWLQRLTSLFYGTSVGRWITLNLALPFGGAFLILKGLQHLGEEATHLFNTPHLPIYSHLGALGLGWVLYALMHWPNVRRAVGTGLFWVWRGLWLLLVTLPRAVMTFPPVAWLLHSLPVRLLWRHVLSPAVVTLILWQGLPRLGAYPEFNRGWAAAVFAIALVVLNSRMGRDTEELFWEWMGRTWHRIRVHVFIGLFNLIVDAFRQLMDALERILYSVDEWLRFRSGESSVALAAKAVLGVVWGLVQSVVRFCITLLIEPQVNPIKHFPIVTVSHKLILPFLPLLAKFLESFFDKYTASLTATAIVTGIPGIFGFLAWELKENWRLYATNRSPTLRPVPVGHHGETLLRLLKPGFHSGTIPKLFAKRRRVARKFREQELTSRHVAYDEKLHHVAEAIRHFIERELLGLLQESRRLGGRRLYVADVVLSTNRIDLVVGDREEPDDPLRMTIAEQSGWLVAGMSSPGWVRRLTGDEQTVVATALAGLYQYGAVDLVREHVEQQWSATPHPYDIDESGLTVWLTRSYETEIHYSLRERPLLTPRPRSAARAAGLEAVPARKLIFHERPLAWTAWRDFWNAEHADAACPPPPLPDVQLIRRT